MEVGMTLTPSFGGRFFARLQHHNPFYFLSAACMLGGILAVTNSLSWTSIPIQRLLVLIATLNIYEAALIALAFYLLRRRNLVRDGVMLLALEAFFLIDITFLNAEIATSHLKLGLIVNIVLFAAAIMKLAVVSHLLGQPPRGGPFSALVLQLAALFALPIVFRWQDQGDLSTQVFYAAWWIIGLLIPASQTLCRRIPMRSTSAWGRRMLVFYLVMPWLSLVLHVSIMHYVYRVSYYGAEAAPMLLALAFVLHQAQPSALMPRKDLLALKFLLPIAAVLVSLNDPNSLCFGIGRFWITPSRLSFAASYLTYVYFYAGAFTLHFLIAGVLAALTFIFGPTMEQVDQWSTRLWTGCGDAISRFIPTTPLEWGATSIAAAFAFLGIGAAVSLGKRSLPPPLPPEAPAGVGRV
jgi:hypothetical protein